MNTLCWSQYLFYASHCCDTIDNYIAHHKCIVLALHFTNLMHVWMKGMATEKLLLPIKLDIGSPGVFVGDGIRDELKKACNAELRPNDRYR